MTDIVTNKNFTDLINARAFIQSNAYTCSDIAKWLKVNPWFVVLAHVEAKSNDWNPYRQQQFLQAYQDFAFKTCKMTHDEDKINILKYRWETSFDYVYAKKKVPHDMEIDIEHALRFLGFTRLGVGAENGAGRIISGHSNLAVPAQDWYFVAEPCIENTVGTSFWDTDKSGTRRWFPNAELESLALVQASLDVSYDDIIAIAKSKLRDTKNRSGFLCGPPEFCL